MKPLLVRDVMTKTLLTIAPDLPMDVAIETMRSNRVRRLPVVSTTNRVIGIITLYDALLATRKDENWLSEIVTPMPTVEEGMTASVITIGPEDTLAHAARIMNTHHIGGLPVVDEMRLVGILTESDLFKLLADLLDPEHAV